MDNDAEHHALWREISKLKDSQVSEETIRKVVETALDARLGKMFWRLMLAICGPTALYVLQKVMEQ